MNEQEPVDYIKLSDERIYRRIRAFKRLMRLMHHREQLGFGPDESKQGRAACQTFAERGYKQFSAEAVWDANASRETGEFT